MHSPSSCDRQRSFLARSIHGNVASGRRDEGSTGGYTPPNHARARAPDPPQGIRAAFDLPASGAELPDEGNHIKHGPMRLDDWQTPVGVLG